MKNVLKYKGYIGSVEFSEKDMIFYGKILGLKKGAYGFEGQDVKELIEDFHNAVDDYLDSCAEMDVEAEKPFSGKFNLRIPPELHKDIAISAAAHNMSLNQYVTDILENNVH